ncbi:PilZ domain-containing protein [Paenibacillus sp. GYB003]|uniref:PilZ domain-containing protein n=1 Tax=Paenibacillus sp. GYB003 TaxID=2994392 RepID=UPI002F9655AC
MNKRSFYRMTLPVPLSGTLKIIGMGRQKLDSKLAPVLIRDIGAGGMRMHAKMQFPVSPDLLLEFRFVLFHAEHKCLGTIVRKSILAGDVSEYGIVFSLDENERRQLLQHLNRLHVRLRASAILPSCSFCTDEQYESFYRTPLSAGAKPDSGVPSAK